MPFGLGSRKCVGDQFALAELLVTVATIVSRWRLCPVPGHTLRPTPRATLVSGPLPMALHRAITTPPAGTRLA
ncbi:cytochrome P450 [Streptomyces sp. NPDC001537]